MTQVVSVKFKSGGKVYYFDPNGLDIESGQGVIVDTANGAEYADCVEGVHEIEDEQVVKPLRQVVRIATTADIRGMEKNPQREAEAFKICEQKIAEYGLDMKLVRVEYNFDGSKILFFFTSDGRIDFRELVRELASIFKTRIVLRQIGVRDEAKMLGGLGICGRPFCCSSFLDEFQSVSIKMAKTQALSLNPTKISGSCGRLMCCLKYEQAAYEDIVKRAPKLNSEVDVPGSEAKGKVVDLNLLRERAKIRVEGKSDPVMLTFRDGELKIIEPEKKTPDVDLTGFLSRYESGDAEAADGPQGADTESGVRSGSNNRRGRGKGGDRPRQQTGDRPQAAKPQAAKPAEAPEKAEQTGDQQFKNPRNRRRRPGGKGSKPPSAPHTAQSGGNSIVTKPQEVPAAQTGPQNSSAPKKNNNFRRYRGGKPKNRQPGSGGGN